MNEFFIDGFGFWSEQMPSWTIAAPVLTGLAPLPSERHRRPAPQGLAPAERRRAPDTVCLAMQSADEAIAASGHDAQSLACVFASSHGDLPLTDYMCDTVATDASALSPIRFHNSVHNAPAGYWTISAGSRKASTALAAYEASFGAGLLEAAVQCAAEQRPVLFVAYDVAAKGALADVTRSDGMLTVAMVVSPVQGPQSLCGVGWSLAPGGHASVATSNAAASLSGNAMRACLPFCEAFARADADQVIISAGNELSLKIELRPIP